jgi:glyoxylase-like metal-dependent hydrolase (beta-lactamase superfamily II)
MSLVVRWVVTGPFQENSYLLMCSETREAILVDPGDDADDIAALVAEEQAKPVAIYATHAHIDHVGAIAELQEKYAVPTYVPGADLEWLEALPLQAQMFRLGEKRIPRVDGDFADGQRIAFGRIEGVGIATPGHTEGGTCLWFEQEKVLVTGDTLFVGSIGRTDLPGGDFSTIARSIRARLFSLPDDVTFYPGHGDPGRLGDERRNNPFVGEAAAARARVPRMP